MSWTSSCALASSSSISLREDMRGAQTKNARPSTILESFKPGRAPGTRTGQAIFRPRGAALRGGYCYDPSRWASVSICGTPEPLCRILPLPRIREARTTGPVMHPLTAHAYLVRTSPTLGGSVPFVCTCLVLHLLV